MENITDFLARLPIEQFVSTVNAACAQRADRNGHMREHLFLGLARHDPREEQRYVWEVVGVPDSAHYDGGAGPDWGLCQSGICQTCSVPLRSNVKHVLCPICGGAVSLT